MAPSVDLEAPVAVPNGHSKGHVSSASEQIAPNSITAGLSGPDVSGTDVSGTEITKPLEEASATSVKLDKATEADVKSAEGTIDDSAPVENHVVNKTGTGNAQNGSAEGCNEPSGKEPSIVREPQSPISPPQERERQVTQQSLNDNDASASAPTPPQSSAAVSPNQEEPHSQPDPVIRDIPMKDSPGQEIDSPSSFASPKHERTDSSVEPAAKRARLDNGSSGSIPAVTFAGPDSQRHMTPNRQKYCMTVLRQLKRSKDAAPFMQPVDPVKLQIPDYFKIVTDPQDLGTIENKLKKNEYTSIDGFIDAIQLVWSNCQRYNGPEAPINLMALRLKEQFERQIRSMPAPELSNAKASPAVIRGSKPKKNGKASPAVTTTVPARPRKPSSPAVVGGVPNIRRESIGIDGRPKREIHAPPPKSLPYQIAPQRRSKNVAQLKFCQIVLKELTHKKNEAFAFPFYVPVDAKALGLHDYHTVIRTPMDLATMQSKLSAGEYESADDFEYDMRLMFRNCFKYNGPGQPVNTMGKRLESLFNERWAEKPVPRTEGYGSDSEDESDVDTSSEKVQMLKKQLEAMQNQIENMKSMKSKKKKKPKRDRHDDDDDDDGMGPEDEPYSRPGKKGSKKKSTALDVVDESPMFPTFEQKTQLSTKMGYMSEHQMPVVLQILRRTDPNFDPEEEEVEIDVDKVHPKTIRLLWNWIMNDIQPSFVRKKVAPAVKKNRVVTTDHEQQKQIAQIEAQLHNLSGGDAYDYNSRYGNVPNDDDSGSSDASSEEDD